MSSNLHRIEPLTGANYSAWKLKLQWILIEQGLWGYVTSDVTQPVPVDTNTVTADERQQIAEWDCKDQQAYAAICLRISDNYIVYTYNTSTSKKVWDTFVTIFEASGPIGIINTRCEFFRTFAQEHKNMEEHIRKLHD